MWSNTFRPFLRNAKFHYRFPQVPILIDGLIVGQLRDLPYLEQWDKCRRNGWYHVYLEDHCFFSFQVDGNPSYVFFDCPLEILSIRDYVAEQGLEPNQKTFRHSAGEYEEYLATAPVRESFTPIRYDYDPVAYRTGVHPVGHLHIGRGNEIRIGLQRVLSPVAFFFFVVRQMYPQNWEHLLRSNHQPALARKIRDQLNLIDEEYVQAFDECEVQLA